MWCKECSRETENKQCELCGCATKQDIPVEIYWCNECKTPIIKQASNIDKTICTICGGQTRYMCADIRPIFPEERLLIEILAAVPFEYKDKSVWASNNRYYIDGEQKVLTKNYYTKHQVSLVSKLLAEHKIQNDYVSFNSNVDKFIKANRDRLNYLTDEATEFIKESSKAYTHERIVISFQLCEKYTDGCTTQEDYIERIFTLMCDFQEEIKGIPYEEKLAQLIG